jgi:hypothetical protein
MLDDEGLDTLAYDQTFGHYRVRLTDEDITKHEAVLRQLIQLANKESVR